MNARCCIAGGGPAGIMLGFLLARAGVDVVVLEKHADFFRDFRGDTIHPSTLEVMSELGLLDGLLKIRHSELRELSGRIGSQPVTIADFRRVPGPCKFIAFMPQWDFLNFLAEQAQRYPSFRLMMETEATDLLRDGNRITGVRVKTPRGIDAIYADLVVACDGRSSTLREAAGLRVLDKGAPIDALWIRLTRDPNAPGQTFGNIAAGGILVAIDRTEYYQCALVIRKNGFAEVQARGLGALRDQIATLAPFLAPHVNEIRTWDDVKLLTVKVDRLETWCRPGLLCIGDAAHAMSPVGGIGINLAIQDAVAAANILTPALLRGAPPVAKLRAVQRRREFPTRVTQAVQVFIQERVLNRFLNARANIQVPSFVRILLSMPIVRRTLARIVGIGVRPEHVLTRERAR
jgi:2-polyprenyl-6-methoxyphenol hydroxylase-like FAD-dependent oxidoreductase